jgi:hypothetical protein
MWAQDPAQFTRTLEATLAATAEQVQQAAQKYLRDDGRVVIFVLPEQKHAEGGAR